MKRWSPLLLQPRGNRADNKTLEHRLARLKTGEVAWIKLASTID